MPREPETTGGQRRAWRISRTVICLFFITQNALLANLPHMEVALSAVLYVMSVALVALIIFVVKPWEAFT